MTAILAMVDEKMAKMPLRFFSSQGGVASKTGQSNNRLDAAIWLQRALQGHATDECESSGPSS